MHLCRTRSKAIGMLTSLENRLHQWFPALKDQLCGGLLRENLHEPAQAITALPIVAMVWSPP